MAEDCTVAFGFKTFFQDERAPIEDPFDFVRTTVYDATFDPWYDGAGDRGMEAAHGDAPDPGDSVDEFDFLL